MWISWIVWRPFQKRSGCYRLDSSRCSNPYWSEENQNSHFYEHIHSGQNFESGETILKADNYPKYRICSRTFFILLHSTVNR
uniref:C2H2-type domain-containing protein n=1 Tax=Caenorhabditis tropicalis TaxID=1561998 RepID=A0A1I7TXV3_9PELO